MSRVDEVDLPPDLIRSLASHFTETFQDSQSKKNSRVRFVKDQDSSHAAFHPQVSSIDRPRTSPHDSSSYRHFDRHNMDHFTSDSDDASDSDNQSPYSNEFGHYLYKMDSLNVSSASESDSGESVPSIPTNNSDASGLSFVLPSADVLETSARSVFKDTTLPLDDAYVVYLQRYEELRQANVETLSKACFMLKNRIIRKQESLKQLPDHAKEKIAQELRTMNRALMLSNSLLQEMYQGIPSLPPPENQSPKLARSRDVSVVEGNAIFQKERYHSTTRSPSREKVSQGSRSPLRNRIPHSQTILSPGRRGRDFNASLPDSAPSTASSIDSEHNVASNLSERDRPSHRHLRHAFAEESTVRHSPRAMFLQDLALNSTTRSQRSDSSNAVHPMYEYELLSNSHRFGDHHVRHPPLERSILSLGESTSSVEPTSFREGLAAVTSLANSAVERLWKIGGPDTNSMELLPKVSTPKSSNQAPSASSAAPFGNSSSRTEPIMSSSTRSGSASIKHHNASIEAANKNGNELSSPNGTARTRFQHHDIFRRLNSRNTLRADIQTRIEKGNRSKSLYETPALKQRSLSRKKSSDGDFSFGAIDTEIEREESLLQNLSHSHLGHSKLNLSDLGQDSEVPRRNIQRFESRSPTTNGAKGSSTKPGPFEIDEPSFIDYHQLPSSRGMPLDFIPNRASFIKDARNRKTN